jgi:hypothetical protein
VEVIIKPTFRSYFWKLASEACLYCRDSHNLCLAKPLRKPFQIQTAECGIKEGEQILAKKECGEPYSIAELSDGERNALLIAATVLTVKPGTLLLIDELERHLHRSKNFHL